MGSSADPERSISSGISIPQWMKTRIGDRYDIEEPFSPPIHDDTFFYIRYPKAAPKSTAKEPPIKLIEEKTSRPPVQDFSQHTVQCRKFISDTTMSVDMKELGPAKPQPPKMKPQSGDDTFPGDGAACGQSVVQVAQQMISGKFLTRGFNNASNDNLAIPPEKEARRRRNSKSLPASPLVTPSQSPESSPHLRKKNMFPNRFFTGNITTLDKAGNQDSTAKYPGSWILSSFLGSREAISVTQSGTIYEDSQDQQNSTQVTRKEETVSKQEEKKESDMRRIKSASTLTSTDSVEEISITTSKLQSKREPLKPFMPKPSELREMNFWSPTSM